MATAVVALRRSVRLAHVSHVSSSKASALEASAQLVSESVTRRCSIAKSIAEQGLTPKVAPNRKRPRKSPIETVKSPTKKTKIKKTQKKPKRNRTSKAAIDEKKPSKIVADKGCDEGAEPKRDCLPRTRELALQLKMPPGAHIFGVDEAGRGPLAGPVVAAAAILRYDIPGVTDSKKITKEEDREMLYERIIKSPGVIWAAAVVDAKRIDEINILQATMQGMKMASQAVMCPPKLGMGREESATCKRLGSYVVCGRNDEHGNPLDLNQMESIDTLDKSQCFALIDGNRLPSDMPCEAEAMVKGDSREFSIAAASIIAKVTRDRIMHGYDAMYPKFQLGKHKGYPTAAHMAAVRSHGASPIHRRTFAPLKHMNFDEDGQIISQKN